jgi:3-isopropylmalate dehydrogenase
MDLRIAVLAGDGIGPEVIHEAVLALDAIAQRFAHRFTFDSHAVGGAAVDLLGEPLPNKTLEACLASDAVLLGAVGGPRYDALPRDLRPEKGLLRLRSSLGLFANLRPVKVWPCQEEGSPLRSERVRGTDLVIVRELAGGLYFGEPRGRELGEAFNTMRYREDEVIRIARVAFDLARSRRGKVASVDKANVLECSQLWRDVVNELGKRYPDVSLEHHYVDSFAMALIAHPSRFDVVLTENLFGDILSDEAAVLPGSLGLLPSASLGGVTALFEPIHGSAPDLAGRGVANPIAAIASSAMLLEHVGLKEESESLNAAIRETVEEGFGTPDMSYAHQVLSTTELGARIRQRVTHLSGAVA